MADRVSFGTVELEVDPHDSSEIESEPLRELDRDSAFRLLVIGNFSGRAGAPAKAIRLDRDNFDKVLARMEPHLEVPLGSSAPGDTSLKFECLEDFEPDSIFRRCEAFASLSQSKQQGLYSEPEEGEAPKPISATPEQIERLTSPGGLLDAIVENTSPSAARSSDEFQAMVERIVAPYSNPASSKADTQAETERLQRFNLLMSHILHDEGFQTLEAAWRGLEFLISRMDTDEKVHLYVLDCAREQLTSPRLKLLLEDERWDLIAANYGFDRAELADVTTLENVGGLAQSLGTRLIAECLPSRADDQTAAAKWEDLRRLPVARFVYLAVPRFLLRLPYGKDTAPIESFPYEEMPGKPRHNDYLWGNPAFLCALAMAENCWRIDGLPVHTYRLANGDAAMQAPAEVVLSERDCQALADDGLLPLAAIKGTDAIMLPHVRSIAALSARAAQK